MDRKVVALLVLLVLLAALPVAAQTPTPPPTPTPTIIHGESGDFVVLATISYGQAAIAIGLLSAFAGQLIAIGLEVAGWLRE